MTERDDERTRRNAELGRAVREALGTGGVRTIWYAWHAVQEMRQQSIDKHGGSTSSAMVVMSCDDVCAALKAVADAVRADAESARLAVAAPRCAAPNPPCFSDSAKGSNALASPGAVEPHSLSQAKRFAVQRGEDPAKAARTFRDKVKACGNCGGRIADSIGCPATDGPCVPQRVRKE